MASAEEPASNAYAFFPCGDDDGVTMAALSPPVVVSVLASLLDRHIARNERATAADHDHASATGDDARRVAAFDGGTVLDTGTRAFLERFSRYAHVSPQVFVVAYAYLDRLRTDAAVRVVSTNAQRLLTAAILVASKFVEDRNYRNSYFAAVGGLSAAELGALELDFLFLMRFRLNVSVSVFRSYCRHLEREAGHGGGYQVERCLEKARVCSGEAQTRHRQAPAAAAAQAKLKTLHRNSRPMIMPIANRRQEMIPRIFFNPQMITYRTSTEHSIVQSSSSSIVVSVQHRHHQQLTLRILKGGRDIPQAAATHHQPPQDTEKDSHPLSDWEDIRSL